MRRVFYFAFPCCRLSCLQKIIGWLKLISWQKLYPVCLNLKCLLTNSDIATVYNDLCILLFILTLKATQGMMREIRCEV